MSSSLMPSAPCSTSASSTAVSSRRYGSGLPASAASAIDWSFSVKRKGRLKKLSM